MGVILGKSVLIYNGASGTTSLIAAAKSCTISKKIELIEKASSTQANAKEYTTGRYEWDVTINHLVVTGSEYAGILKVGQRILISTVVGTVRKKGYAICTQADISAPVHGLAQGVVKFKGDGEFDI